jgi:potassium-dependent mechanosensitive channel
MSGGRVIGQYAIVTARTNLRGVCARALVSTAHALAAFVVLGSALAASAQPTARPVASAAQSTQALASTITPIPIPEIAQRAEQINTLLRSLQTPEPSGFDDAELELTRAADWIHQRHASTTDALASSPSANALASLADSWQAMRSRLVALNDKLTRRATLVQQRVEQIETMRATWAATRASAREAAGPSTVLEQIDATMAVIAAARNNADDGLAHVLALQDRTVKEIARCDDALARIAKTENALVGPLLAPDAPPIWGPEARTLISDDVGQRLREAVRDMVERARDYMAGEMARLPLQMALFALTFVLMRLARRRARRRADKQPSEAAAAQVFELPLSSALVVALIPTGWIYPQPPRVLISAVSILVLLPAVRIVRRLASAVIVPAVYALAAFFVVDRVRDVCSVVPVLEQWVFLLQMVCGIVFLALAVRSERLMRGSGQELALGWQHAIVAALWIQAGLLVAAVFMGVCGYMRLARLLGNAVLGSDYAALVLYAGVRVGEGLIAYALRALPLRDLLIVQRHRPLVQRRLTLAVRWLSVGAWAYFTLDGLGVIGPVASAGATLLGARYVRGSVSVSLGDVAAFALTVWAVFLLSSFVRFVLDEEVYPRVRLPRGAAYALATIVHYLIIVSGFVFAVAALGIDLNRVTIVAGALGVGVGIGLQSVVANFVSGLILLLERRLHVGDAVQLGTLEGRIREIGIRASTIRTWDGAEVIVPNAALTSERVTNWTLSDTLRRVTLDVGVAYSADPRHVLEILRSVATAHPKALSDPPPVALCTGFGDSALKFELRVWTSVDDAESFLSQLAIAVHGALSAAKIEIPFPQRDVHIRNGESAPVGSLSQI